MMKGTYKTDRHYAATFIEREVPTEDGGKTWQKRNAEVCCWGSTQEDAEARLTAQLDKMNTKHPGFGVRVDESRGSSHSRLISRMEKRQAKEAELERKRQEALALKAEREAAGGRP